MYPVRSSLHAEDFVQTELEGSRGEPLEENNTSNNYKNTLRTDDLSLAWTTNLTSLVHQIALYYPRTLEIEGLLSRAILEEFSRRKSVC